MNVIYVIATWCPTTSKLVIPQTLILIFSVGLIIRNINCWISFFLFPTLPTFIVLNFNIRSYCMHTKIDRQKNVFVSWNENLNCFSRNLRNKKINRINCIYICMQRIKSKLDPARRRLSQESQCLNFYINCRSLRMSWKIYA